MDFKNGVINIQAKGYNGAHTVLISTYKNTFKAKIDSFLTSMLIIFFQCRPYKFYICFALLRLVEFVITTYKFFVFNLFLYFLFSYLHDQCTMTFSKCQWDVEDGNKTKCITPMLKTAKKFQKTPKLEENSTTFEVLVHYLLLTIQRFYFCLKFVK